MIVGTAGHIDHGKSTLVRALTGVETDRLPEEKARGMSIELGYAYLPLRADADDPAAVLGFVDVPGHERFLHHMLAGVGGIDFALLVVALDDGVMPQTREHLQILQLLALAEGAVVLTKRDRVDEKRVQTVMAQLDALERGTFLQGSARFVVSCHSGDGVGSLKSYLMAKANERPPHASSGGFRLAIDRCFTLQGVGTVVTGTARAGRVQVGDTLTLCPGATTVRVRSLHVHNLKASAGHAGQRCAINVTGLRLDRQQVRRGQWLVAEGLDESTSELDISLTLLPDEIARLRTGRALQVHLHLGTEHVLARLYPLEDGLSSAQGPLLARVALPRPVAAVCGDRLVLRDAAGSRTLGGGRVVDPFPPRRGRRTPARLAWLRACADAGPVTALSQLDSAFPEGLPLTQWRRMANLSAAAASELLARLPVVQAPGPLLFGAGAWDTAGDALLALLHAEHARAPEAAGLLATALRKRLRPRWSAAAFDALLVQMKTDGRLGRTASAWHLPAHRVRLGEAKQRHWQRIEPLLAARPMAPPRVDQLARQLDIPEAEIRATLDRVCQTGVVCRVSEERYYLRTALATLAGKLRGLARPGDAAHDQPITAAQVRDEIGIGRNLIVALLEFFDRSGCTRRVGDMHWLCEEQALELEET